MDHDNTQYCVLRLFGMPQKQLAALLREAQAKGCPGLRLLARDGEFAVCVTAHAPTQDQARRICAQWEQYLCDRFGSAVFGSNDLSLAQAALDTLLGGRVLTVAADPAAGQWLNETFDGLEHAEAVYDFGNASFDDAAFRKKLEKAEQLGTDALDGAVRRAQKAMQLTHADLAVSCHAADWEAGTFVLVTDRRRAWAVPLAPDAPQPLALNTLLDLIRRFAGGLEPGADTQCFRPGHDCPDPQAFAPPPSLQQNAPAPEQAVQALYDQDKDRPRTAARTPGSAPKRRNLLPAALLAILLVVGATLAGLWLWGRLGSAPAFQGYGTAAFDLQAQSYLSAAQEKRGGVQAYLALPGQEGALIYAAETAQDPDAAESTVGDIRPGSPHSNAVIACRGGLETLSGLSERSLLDRNSGFTLYTEDAILRCKILAVCWYDPAQTENAFDPTRLQDLANYKSYLDLVLQLRTRSLFDLNVSTDENDRFVTLVFPDRAGARLAVTARLLRENESALLDPSAITAAAQPLCTQAQYEAQGQSQPEADALLAGAMQGYLARNEQPAPVEEQPSAPASSGSDAKVEALGQATAELLAQTDALLKGLTDIAGAEGAVEANVDQGAEGALPETEISVEQAAQNEGALDTPSVAPEGGGTPESVASAEGRTLDVTMNGTPQTLDLVTCLAMIAQNELGSGQPQEAYKAQAVAAHSWILSQGSYPAVSGQAPSETVLEAVRQVATVLITYNGGVCFTPYCASVSTGTVSCKDVWGSDRPWLQAVESPYDGQYASNWNTNGMASGTARFAAQTVKNRVAEKLGIDLSGIEPTQWFKVLSANPHGYVTQMQIGNEQSGSTTCSGRWFRENLLIYQSVDGRSLRSCSFTYYFDAGLDCFIFDVYGYGHGVGMSQRGAVGYADNGWTYDQILAHYYTGTTLVSY